MTNTEYISLICIDPASNKWRSYDLVVSDNEVLSAWGRVGKHRRKLTKEFDEESIKLKYIQSLLLRRKRNGYKIIEKSEGFPDVKVLNEIPITNNIAGQLRFF